MFLMRRFLLAFTATVAGLAALLSFKSISSSAGTTAAGTTSAGATSAATTPAASTPASTAAAKSDSKGSGASAKTGGSTTTTSRVIKGSVEQSPYGPTQVEVTLDGTKLVDVTVLQHTDDGTMSMEIDSNALPQLTKEALAAQSAKIDAVSGASYTSAGYIDSLQSALDQA
jgi:uncharacterized protein with FMN-binding domain